MIMSKIVVRPVRSRADQRRFLNLPWELYSGDPNWVPPLRQNQRELAGFCRHPFYDDAEIETFLAWSGGQPCGRIAAIVNHGHNRRHEEPTGFFGFFECVNDPNASMALLDEVRLWLADRGLRNLRGPANPSLNYECGLLVDGFDSRPTFMMTYNPPYYASLLESCGFEKSQDMYAFVGRADMLSSLDSKLDFVIEEVKRRFDIRLRRLDTKRFREDVRIFLDIYNRSLGGTWGFVPMSPGELDRTSAALRHLLVPSMTSVAEVDGRPVGAVFGMLDYNPLVKQIDGRLFPFGFARLLWNRRKIDRVRLISTNVLPEFQRWGLGLVLANSLLDDGLAWGLREAEFSWVLESNQLSRGTLERGGAQRVKTWRLYDHAG